MKKTAEGQTRVRDKVDVGWKGNEGGYKRK